MPLDIPFYRTTPLQEIDPSREAHELPSRVRMRRYGTGPPGGRSQIQNVSIKLIKSGEIIGNPRGAGPNDDELPVGPNR
jgi:hypothetical protein